MKDNIRLFEEKLNEIIDNELDKNEIDCDVVIETAEGLLRLEDSEKYQVDQSKIDELCDNLRDGKTKKVSVKKVALIAAVIAIIAALTSGVYIGMNNRISNELAIHMKDAEEQIPVYIWFEDLDLEAIHEAVYQKIGYSQEDLDKMDAEIPRYEGSGEDEEAYLAYIESVRLPQKKIQDKQNRLIEEERTAEKEAYLSYNNLNIELLNISFEQVKYVSMFSPMVIANQTREEIVELQKNDLVIDMEYKDPNPPIGE